MAKRLRKLTDGAGSCGGGSVISYHLENAGTKRRKKSRPKAEVVDICKIIPETTDFKNSRIITWHIQTGSYALRFLDNCLQVTLVPQYKNSKFTDANADNADQARLWNGCTPFGPSITGEKNDTRVAFFNPLTGGPAPLIEEVEIYLDNQLVQTNRSGFISLTNTLNHLFLPADKRQNVLGHEHILNGEDDRKKIAGATTNAKHYKSYAYEYALDSFNAVKPDNKAQAVTLQGNLLGIFPLSPPKCYTLEQISPCESGGNQLPLIPPQVDITIRMRLADPLYLRAIDSNQDDDNFFSNTDPTSADSHFRFNQPTDIRDFNYDIKSIAFLAQKIKWDSEDIQKQMTMGSLDYYYDQYIYRTTSLGRGQVVSNIKDTIPAHTRMFYLIIVKSNQLYKDAGGVRSSDASRFSLPINLEKINIRLNGRVILFESGLTLSRTKASSQEDAAIFYQYLRNRNLTTDSFNSFFPKNGAIGYKNAFPIDLEPYCLEEPAHVQVELTWDKNGCPNDYYVAIFIPQEVNVSRDSPSSIWKSTATIS